MPRDRPKYRKFPTRDEADAWLARLNRKFGYPNKDTRTYSKVVDHPTNGCSYVLCCPKSHRYMNREDRQLLEGHRKVDADGLFPIISEDF